MSASRAWLHRLVPPAVPPIPAGRIAPDHIGELLHAAIDADEHAKTRNAETYAARVEAMVGDFFEKYGDRQKYGDRHDRARS